MNTIKFITIILAGLLLSACGDEYNPNLIYMIPPATTASEKLLREECGWPSESVLALMQDTRRISEVEASPNLSDLSITSTQFLATAETVVFEPSVDLVFVQPLSGDRTEYRVFKYLDPFVDNNLCYEISIIVDTATNELTQDSEIILYNNELL